ncbi:5'-nucleotidase C-terminal domain-containing protein [Candidatus Poriferisodalis sp.]|uniref:5'-nucleotidase C-terminal domain-containing protein n=1 Tax=Candidatus Poriferisodalis sp. TaxID=3101277 RepID=UPI003D09A75D
MSPTANGSERAVRRRKTKYLRAAVAAIVMLAALPFAAEPLGAQSDGADAVPTLISAGPVTLTILHNNDGESKLLPDPDSGFPGIARFVAQMRELQAAAAGDGPVVTLTSGDNFLASLELGVSLDRDGPMYDSVALSGLYDATALGNHDFDFGPEVTARFIEGFSPQIPFLSANIDVSAEPALAALAERSLVAPSTVIESADERIGVIGAVTPWLPNISSPRNVVVSAVLPAVQAEADRLASEGVNKIVLVSHLQDVDEEVALVAELTGVDVVIAGGGDDLLANPGDTCQPDDEPVAPYPKWVADAAGAQVPVVTAPGGYRCIGKLVVTFDADGNVTAATGSSIGVALDREPDATMQTEVVEPLTSQVALVDSAEIGTSEVDLEGRKSVLRTQSTNIGSLMADALRVRGAQLAPGFGVAAPQVAIGNGGGLRNDSVIPAGQVSVGTTWDIAPFNNVLVTGTVSRATLAELLERALSGLPGASGQYPHVSGMTVTYDPDGVAQGIDRDGDCGLIEPTGSRLRSVTLDDGTQLVRDGDVVPGAPIALATVDFLGNGGDCYPLGDINFTRLGVTYQQALADYITEDLGGVISAEQYPVDGGNRISALAAGGDGEEEGEQAEDGQAEDGQAEDGQNGDIVLYTVQLGDTLQKIAAAHLAHSSHWPVIFEANEGRAQSYGGALTDPDLILVGWVLYLPER